MRSVKIPLTIPQHEQIKKESLKKGYSQPNLAKYIFILGAKEYFSKQVNEPIDLQAGD